MTYSLRLPPLIQHSSNSQPSIHPPIHPFLPSLSTTHKAPRLRTTFRRTVTALLAWLVAWQHTKKAPGYLHYKSNVLKNISPTSKPRESDCWTLLFHHLGEIIEWGFSRLALRAPQSPAVVLQSLSAARWCRLWWRGGTCSWRWDWRPPAQSSTLALQMAAPSVPSFSHRKHEFTPLLSSMLFFESRSSYHGDGGMLGVTLCPSSVAANLSSSGSGGRFVPWLTSIPSQLVAAWDLGRESIGIGTLKAIEL